MDIKVPWKKVVLTVRRVYCAIFREGFFSGGDGNYTAFGLPQTHHGRSWQPYTVIIYIYSCRTSQPAWQIIYSSLRLLEAGQTLQRERTHSLSSLPTLLAVGLTIFFLSPHRESTKHYEENISNLWAIGVWEIIFSSFIFPSKSTDPQRNKLDIFNSYFDFSILIPVLTTAFQLLYGLQHFNSCPDDSISTPALTSAS